MINKSVTLRSSPTMSCNIIYLSNNYIRPSTLFLMFISILLYICSHKSLGSFTLFSSLYSYYNSSADFFSRSPYSYCCFWVKFSSNSTWFTLSCGTTNLSCLFISLRIHFKNFSPFWWLIIAYETFLLCVCCSKVG